MQAQGRGGSMSRRDDCCGEGPGVQALGQSAHNEQDADADAVSEMLEACNANLPVDLFGKGKGKGEGKGKDEKRGGGSVGQANDSAGNALGLNLNGASQRALQAQGR